MRHAETDMDTESISGHAFFKEFEAHTASKLVDLGIEARFDPGKVIFEEHESSGQFYFITQGSVALEQPGLGRPVRIQTLHEGDFFGWSALLGSGTRHFKARALAHVVALTFDGALLRKTCENDPQFGYALMKRLLMLVTERLDATRTQVTCV